MDSTLTTHHHFYFYFYTIYMRMFFWYYIWGLYFQYKCLQTIETNLNLCIRVISRVFSLMYCVWIVLIFKNRRTKFSKIYLNSQDRKNIQKKKTGYDRKYQQQNNNIVYNFDICQKKANKIYFSYFSRHFFKFVCVNFG